MSRDQIPQIRSIPLADLNLRPTGDGVMNNDGSEAAPHSRLSASLAIGPFHLHVEAYEVRQVEDGAGYTWEVVDDAWSEELESCFEALIEGCPEAQEINGRLYVLRAFPFAE